MLSFMTDTITVIRPTYATERGNQIPVWTGAPEHTIANCRAQPFTGDELLAPGSRDAIITVWKVYAPPGADILSTDRVRLSDGQTYEVQGSLQKWNSPTGSLASTQFTLKLVEG